MLPFIRKSEDRVGRDRGPTHSPRGRTRQNHQAPRVRPHRPRTRSAPGNRAPTARSRARRIRPWPGPETPPDQVQTPSRADGAVVARHTSRLLWDSLQQAYRACGFARVKDDALEQLVLARLMEPTSKTGTGRVLEDRSITPVHFRRSGAAWLGSRNVITATLPRKPARLRRRKRQARTRPLRRDDVTF